MSDVAVQLYEVRLLHKTGTVVNYNFADVGRADAARKLVAKSISLSRTHTKDRPPEPAIFEFYDDAGRAANCDAADFSGVTMVDLTAELVNTVRMKLYAEMQLARLDPKGAAERERAQHMSNPGAGTIGAIAAARPVPEFSA